MRRHEFRAARTWIQTMYPGVTLGRRLLGFFSWSLHTMWRTIPDAAERVRFASPVSRTPVWLRDPNPLSNHPWKNDPQTQLPQKAEVVVIGAGFVGAGAAYHWSKHSAGKKMVVLEMKDPASGAGGRNAGVVTMGRYYHQVHTTVLKHLSKSHPQLSDEERINRAHEFARPYVKAGVKSNQMIEQTIADESIDCDYIKKGWVWAAGEKDADKPLAAQRMGEETGFTDWIRISAEEAMERAGISTSHDAGYSRGTATWHPAKWIWGLFQSALRSANLELLTRTRVLEVVDAGDHYEIRTDRGVMRANSVINASESHTAALFREFHGVLRAGQTQAAYGEAQGGTMESGVAVSSPGMFFCRFGGQGVLFGSDMSAVPDREAGSNQPSRFITRYVGSFLKSLFSIDQIEVANEWSGTVGMTPDEFPLIGLQDDRGLYIVGGLAGSGSGVSFLATRFIVFKILGLDGPDDYPEEFFSPRRFFRTD